MLSYVESALIIAVGLLGTYVLIRVIDFSWPHHLRSQHNEFIGLQIGVLGTTYAVILGFMISNVWTAFRQASIDASTEASALLSVYHASTPLPEPWASSMQQLARVYAQQAVQVEWPAMSGHQDDFPTRLTLLSMWSVQAHATRALPPGSLDATTQALETLQEQRFHRIEQYGSHLPNMLWCVLLWGAIGVTLSSLLFGYKNTRVQAFYVLPTVGLLLLSLTAMADIDRPFEGGLYVEPTAFQTALLNMQ